MYNQPLDAAEDWVLADTYLLADRFIMEACKNAVVDRAKIVMREATIHPGCLHELCKHGLSKCALGRYFWAQLAFELMDIGFEEYVKDDKIGGAVQQLIETQEDLVTFMRVLDNALRDRLRGKLQDPSKIDDCEYHEHKETQRCRKAE
jgi:hypothetical protein